jgi:branched-chain amino acid transport system ATP-binding protein
VVESLCNVITVLQRGAILAEGPYDVVSKDPRVLEAYVGVEAGAEA